MDAPFSFLAVPSLRSWESEGPVDFFKGKMRASGSWLSPPGESQGSGICVSLSGDLGVSFDIGGSFSGGGSRRSQWIFGGCSLAINF